MLLFGAGFCLSPTIAKPARHLFSARVNAYRKMLEPACDFWKESHYGIVNVMERSPLQDLSDLWQGDLSKDKGH